jgi:hypothetical protein
MAAMHTRSSLLQRSHTISSSEDGDNQQHDGSGPLARDDNFDDYENMWDIEQWHNDDYSEAIPIPKVIPENFL